MAAESSTKQLILKENYGPWAVITGGSEGIGAEIGNFLAGLGINIVIVAHGREALLSQKEHLQKKYKVKVIAQVLDLADPHSIPEIITLTEQLDVGFFAHVACGSVLGSYLDSSRESHRKALQINVHCPDELTWHFASRMRERKRAGGIVLCSSMASLDAFPFNAQYASSKAYIRLLGEALWYEFREYNIDVLSVVLGEVATPALLRAVEKANPEKMQSPLEISESIFSHLGKVPSVVPGRKNQIQAKIIQHVIPKQKMMGLFAKEIRRFIDQ